MADATKHHLFQAADAPAANYDQADAFLFCVSEYLMRRLAIRVNDFSLNTVSAAFSLAFSKWSETLSVCGDDLLIPAEAFFLDAV